MAASILNNLKSLQNSLHVYMFASLRHSFGVALNTVLLHGTKMSHRDGEKKNLLWKKINLKINLAFITTISLYCFSFVTYFLFWRCTPLFFLHAGPCNDLMNCWGISVIFHNCLLNDLYLYYYCLMQTVREIKIRKIWCFGRERERKIRRFSAWERERICILFLSKFLSYLDIL